MKKTLWLLAALLIGAGWASGNKTKAQPLSDKDAVTAIVKKVNDHWQATRSYETPSFWNWAAYHVGNMEAYRLTGNTAYLNYSVAWAEHNDWKGAKGNDKSKWKWTYGESDDFPLFGDHQTCFQTFADLYNIKPDSVKIARAKEVLEYQMSLNEYKFWWWVDGLFMCMPTMVKMYNITQDRRYLEKMYEYWTYADYLMRDPETGLYYRDAKYIYPEHQTDSGAKDFWARGDGWLFAAWAKVLKELPEDDPHRDMYISRYKEMAASIAACQQEEGHWTRSMLDKDFAPGYETSGTAFFTYGFLWGINNGFLDKETYAPVALKAWKYLSETALQEDGTVGYVQPIGERAIPGQTLDSTATADFGVGAFLLAGCEMVRFIEANQ